MSNQQAIKANTRPVKKALVESTTKDVTVDACIFDLIDNAIDAFRENPLEALPDDYAGYTIEIKMSETEFLIKDSGIGISQDILSNSALRYGATLPHGQTIGVFGVGLNRALFKMGTKSRIQTETSNSALQVELDVVRYLNDDDWDLPITELAISGHSGTKIQIWELDLEVAKDFVDAQWVKSFLTNASRRYAKFINRGLIININEDSIASEYFSIKDKSPFLKTWTMQESGVTVEIKLGQHADHKFGFQLKDGSKNIINLSKSGWNVFCNNRGVLILEKSFDVGWTTSPHSEHAGFIGEVNFIGDSTLLPWNTSKTGIDLNSKIYKKALEKMREFSSLWRSFARESKNGKQPDLSDTKWNDLPLSEISEDGSLPPVEGDGIPLAPKMHGNKGAQKPQGCLFEDISGPTQSPADTVTGGPVENADPLVVAAEASNPYADSDVPETKVESGEPPSDDFHEEALNDDESLRDDGSDEESSTGSQQQKERKFRRPEYPLNRDYLFGTSKSLLPFKIPEDQFKTQVIVKELADLNIKEKKFAVMMLLRALIELSLHYYWKNRPEYDGKKKLDGYLYEQAEKCLSSMKAEGLLNNKDHSHAIWGITAICNNRSKIEQGTLQYLQICLHSETQIWSLETLLTFYENVKPLLINCYVER